jgi:ABC-type uncharacterized transport system permease subunit
MKFIFMDVIKAQFLIIIYASIGEITCENVGVIVIKWYKKPYP